MAAGEDHKRALDQRRCVQLGLAAVIVRDKQPALRYDWEEIQRAWLLWPNASLIEFCSHYELKYRVVMNRGCCQAREKKNQIATVNVRYREMVLRAAMVPHFNAEQDADMTEGLRQVLKNVYETAALGASYARSKIGKMLPDGKFIPSSTVSAKEVKIIMEINEKAVAALHGILDLKDKVMPSADKDGGPAEIQPVQRDDTSVAGIVSNGKQVKLAR